jgi:hypothetical protein
MKSRSLIHLAEKLSQKHAELKSWPKVSIAYGVLTPEGKPNPRLAQMIATGYEPRKPETQIRLGLSPICLTCKRKLSRLPHQLPAWLLQAIQNLANLEAKAHPWPDGDRVYARGGQRVRIPVRETLFADGGLQNMTTTIPPPHAVI